MNFLKVFIAMCALLVLSAALPVRDSTLNYLINSSVGQKLLQSDHIILRSPRSIINAGCPEKQFRFGNRCMTCEEYTIKFEDDNCPLDNEID